MAVGRTVYQRGFLVGQFVGVSLGQKCGRNNQVVLKGHSHLAHMRIRYHFIANLHILFLTRSKRTHEQKDTHEHVFQKTIENKAKHCET